LEDRRNVGESSCNFGDGTGSKGPILDVYDADDEVYVLMRAVFYVTYRLGLWTG